MATVICCDGLAGDGELVFERLTNRLEGHGYHVDFADIKDVQTHKDRIQAVLKKVRSVHPKEKIILVGYSAGGSACHIASREINQMRVSGLVLISPAMPRGIPVFTTTLTACMLRHFLPLISSRGELILSSGELISLSGPLDMKATIRLLRQRRPVSLPEARELAFYPPRFRVAFQPVLYCYGTQDRWINPRAHRKYVSRLHQVAPLFAPIYAKPYACGHNILSSRFGDLAAEEIGNWINCFLG